LFSDEPRRLGRRKPASQGATQQAEVAKPGGKQTAITSSPRRAKGGSPPNEPRLLREAGSYNPEPERERIRSRLAQWLVFLLGLIAIVLIALTAAGKLTIEQAKDLALAVLTPVVAITASALGFYFSAHRRGE